MSQVTIAQAAFLTAKSRQTINKFTKNGKLSHSQNAEGAKVIEISELQRVFPLVRKFEELDQMDAGAQEEGEAEERSPGVAEQLAVLHVKLENLEKERDNLKTERERERELYQQQIDSLQNSLNKIQDHHGRAMLMLTDQTEGGQNRQQNVEQVVQQLVEKVERQGQQNKILLRRLKEQEKQIQKKTGFWKWLTGGGQSAPKQVEVAAQRTANA